MKEKKALLAIVGGLILLALVFVIGTNRADSKESPVPNQENNVAFVDEMVFEGAELPVATITVKGYGDLVAELYPDIAPNTVANFIHLAQEGFYDGLTIHRVVEDFVIQGGDPMGTGMGGPGYTIKGEFVENGHTANIHSHTQGVLSMARRGDGNDTAGSQFFVVTSDAKSLDGKYAAFGKMTEGYDILAELNRVSVISVQTGQPTVPIVIERITIDTKGQTYHEPEVTNAQ